MFELDGTVHAFLQATDALHGISVDVRNKPVQNSVPRTLLNQYSTCRLFRTFLKILQNRIF